MKGMIERLRKMRTKKIDIHKTNLQVMKEKGERILEIELELGRLKSLVLQIKGGMVA